MQKRKPIIFTIVGYKRSGKTALITLIVPYLKKKGYKVGVIKHDAHEFDADIEGRDSYRHKQAGADCTLVFSDTKFMMVKDVEKVPMQDLFPLMDDMDIIIVEGGRTSSYPKIEIVRKAKNSQGITSDPKLIMALVTDFDFNIDGIQTFEFGDMDSLMPVVYEYIEQNLGAQ